MSHRIARSTLFLLTTALIPFLEGCGGPPPVNGEILVGEARSQRLTALAVGEAGKIADADMRLTRQLNLADAQIDRNWTADARGTLASARQTLGSPDAAKLSDQTRLSGWVSISQLSRRIHDTTDAATATDTALRELQRIEDPAKRCEFVMGLANELQYIRGKPAAAALLASAGPWTKWIDNLSAKRQALIAFSTALFNLDDFDAGQKMLELESDVAWRSDVLANMAQAAQEVQGQAVMAVALRATVLESPASTLAPGDAGKPAEPFYGKSLDYEQNFKNKRNSLTTKE